MDSSKLSGANDIANAIPRDPVPSSDRDNRFDLIKRYAESRRIPGKGSGPIQVPIPVIPGQAPAGGSL